MWIVRLFIAIAALSAGLAVAAGAFASHALKAKLSERALQIFETGARYEMYHALALLLVALLLSRAAGSNLSLTIAGVAFMIGTLLFSGSLYALSLTGIKILGAITPFGGLAFLFGWVSLAIAAYSQNLFANQ